MFVFHDKAKRTQQGDLLLATLLKEEDLWQQLELPDNPDGTAFRREDSPHVLQIIKIIGMAIVLQRRQPSATFLASFLCGVQAFSFYDIFGRHDICTNKIGY